MLVPCNVANRVVEPSSGVVDADADATGRAETAATAPTAASARIFLELKRSFFIVTHHPWCALAAGLSHIRARPLALRPRLTPGLPFSVGFSRRASANRNS